MLRATIPEINELKKLPEDLRWERGKRTEIEKEKGYSSKKLVWECIFRAHRDVLSGRKNIMDYSSLKKDGINEMALDLYSKITKSQKPERLSSEKLISHLMNKNKEGYRIGPVQKLVNMTLKDMFLLQLFEKLDDYIINENDCDCPLDNRIMETLGMGNFKWTKNFDDTNNGDGYQNNVDIQNEIKERQGEKSNLLYDFENWQRF